MTTLAQDTMIRADQTALGLASDGLNTWGSITNSATANIVSHEAVVSNCVSGFPVVLLGSNTTADINFLVRCSQTNNIFDGIGPCFRVVDANNLYFVAFYAGTGGLVFAKLTGGGFSSIATGSFSLANGAFSWMRVIMSGNHLQVYAWVDGGSQPGTPQIDVTDSSYTAAGQFGMSFNVFASNTDVVKFDSISVTDNQSSSLADHPFVTRFRQYAIAGKKWKTRFFQYVPTQKLFSTRFNQVGQGQKLFVSRFSQYKTVQKLFATRFRHIDHITAQHLFATRFRQYAVTTSVVPVTGHGRDGGGIARGRDGITAGRGA